MIDYFFKKNRLLVLIYHRVLKEADPYRPGDPTVAVFENQMDILKRYFNVLHIKDAIEALQNNTIPPRAVTITFDDGYLDNYTHALPIMEKAGLPFTIFVTTGYFNGECMWNDAIIELVKNYEGDTIDIENTSLGVCEVRSVEQKVLCVKMLLKDFKYTPLAERYTRVESLAEILGMEMPKNLMMSEEVLYKVSTHNVEIGAHTVNHPILNMVNTEQAHSEIRESKKRLENIINKKVDYFAYPNGKPGVDYSSQHVEIVMGEGFKAAFSTEASIATTQSEIYQLPRIGPWHDTKISFSAWLVKMFCL